jgi:hypothetical protein
MEPARFDAVTADLGGTTSRRRLLALLGGGAASSGLALLGLRAADAKDKRKPKQPRICRPGKRLASVDVPSTGTAVSTPPLQRGQQYRLRASGFWITNAQFGNDAFAAFPFANVNAPQLTFQGVRLGLSVDGATPDQWGSYNAGHTYEQTISGQGRALSLRFTDPATSDNSGSLTVEVFCA